MGIDVCEHGSIRRKCPHCEVLQLDAEVARLSRELGETNEALAACRSEAGGVKTDAELFRAIEKHRIDVQFFAFSNTVSVWQHDNLRSEVRRSSLEQAVSDLLKKLEGQ